MGRSQGRDGIYIGPYPHVKEKKSINRILRLYKGWDNSARPTTAKMMVGIENLE